MVREQGPRKPDKSNRLAWLVQMIPRRTDLTRTAVHVGRVCRQEVLAPSSVKGWRRDDLIKCDSFFYTARLQKKTLRLLIMYTAGFVSGEDAKDGNTSFIAIGKCSPL